MKKPLIALILALACSIGWAADKVPAHPHILVETTEGSFKLELDGKAAPMTVANFLKLVDSGFYDGTIFHRIIPDFMVQGGGFTPGFKKKEPDDTIPNESGNGLQNLRGTISMARTGDPHSAGSQFFINVADNVSTNPDTSNLDPVKHTTKGRWGYAVFGFVFEGMDVVDTISKVRTGPGGQFRQDVPVTPIVITKASRVVYDD